MIKLVILCVLLVGCWAESTEAPKSEKQEPDAKPEGGRMPLPHHAIPQFNGYLGLAPPPDGAFYRGGFVAPNPLVVDHPSRDPFFSFYYPADAFEGVKRAEKRKETEEKQKVPENKSEADDE